MPKNNLSEQTEFVLSLAIAKCGDLQDAQDVTQEVLIAVLCFIEKGGTIENMRAFLSAILNRKYYDMLRRKYRLPTVAIGDDFDVADRTDFTHEIEQNEQAAHIRREVAFLTESYRKVIVKHYFYHQSVKEIADELVLAVGTVKSRLDFGRKQMKKGLETMERYTENSYMSQQLLVNNSGWPGLNEEPASLVQDDVLAQNLLILAYEKPITLSDLSKAIGVATAYVEPVVNKLVNGELMKRMGDGKVYTDFIIYEASDYVKYIHEAEAFVEQHIDAYTTPLKTAIEELRATAFYSERLERFMLIQIASAGLYESMESVYKKPQVFPDRPNGGRWIAFGTIYPENYTIPEDRRGKEEYMLSGRRLTVIERYLKAEDLKMYNYETSLYPMGCAKYEGFGCHTYLEAEDAMLKLIYLLKKGIDPDEVAFDPRVIKAMPLLEERGFIKTTNGYPELLVPVLTHAQEKQFFDICWKAQAAFGERIREPLREWCDTHKKAIPPHLTSVPDQKRTMPYSPGTMMFVYEAINRGLHPRDLGYPCPETFAVFD